MNGYTRELTGHVIQAGGAFEKSWSLEKFFGWYDVTVSSPLDAAFARQLAGHVENGQDSRTDPAIAGTA